MDSRDLTKEETKSVQEYCLRVDEYLEAFKRCRDLKALTKNDEWMIFRSIADLPTRTVKATISKTLAPRDEIFEVFSLAWMRGVHDRKSSTTDTTKISGLLTGFAQTAGLSDEMSLAFGKKGLLRMVLEDLKTGKLDDDLKVTGVGIVYHCSWRVPKNCTICREYLDTFHKLSQSGQPAIQANAFLILSYIADAKLEAHRLALNEPSVKYLMAQMKTSLSKSKKKSPGYTHYSALEISKGLHQLAADEKNKVLLAELGGIDLLRRILVEVSSSDEERLWAARGIWQLAIKEENKAKIRHVKNIFTTLKRIMKTTSNLGLQEACSRTLTLINDVVECEDDASNNSSSPSSHDGASGKSPKIDIGSSRKPSEDGHIMISYQWDSQKKVIQVKKYLEKQGYNVWMDVDKMQGNILNSMALAVQNASVVLICATQKYSESQNCRTEAQYAYKQKKDIIPLMLEEGFEPRDWLGALIGMEKYFPLYSDELMKKTPPEIIKELGDRGKWEKNKVSSFGDVTKGNAKDVRKAEVDPRSLPGKGMTDKGQTDKTKTQTDKTTTAKTDKAKTSKGQKDKTKTDKGHTDKTMTEKGHTVKIKVDKRQTDKEKAEKEQIDKTKADRQTDKTSKTDKGQADKPMLDKGKADKEQTDKALSDKTKTGEEQSDKESNDVSSMHKMLTVVKAAKVRLLDRP
ncbi:uncharacterized protein LOC121406296 [Lytechinus variegatus]|uniref:uncharacterized protein LOC121406296 n=1 Tax=Lytechinus variegatus TaxID=7654 RepID=UPI001BB0F063|nr:uncharacterized protein LOC121406296 [Lytechinus variegatus]